jgi:hypothetical protein
MVGAMISHPKLPGTPTRRARRQVDDEPAAIDRAQLACDLLTALEAGPLMKWELRERLHINEGIIFRALKKLKADGHVKIVGKVLDKRAWALVSWQRPVVEPVSAFKASLGYLKPKGPTDSWWATPNLSWEEFTARRQARDRECGRDGSGQMVRR